MNPDPQSPTPVAEGFPAAASRNARVLVLGSLPGVQSIAAGQYYAHPRNAFWHIIEQLFDISRSLPYVERINELNAHGIALWDVLRASRRKGSLDSAIDDRSAVANDIGEFLAAHTHIELLAFNGKASGRLFRRHVAAHAAIVPVRTITLPSTSPAHAAMSFADKLQQWQQIRIASQNDA